MFADLMHVLFMPLIGLVLLTCCSDIILDALSNHHLLYVNAQTVVSICSGNSCYEVVCDICSVPDNCLLYNFTLGRRAQILRTPVV